MMARLSPRIAIVQFQPKLGQVQANMAKARELCRGIPPQSVDLICLPEMAFSGYSFDSAAAIEPYLEPRHTGPTSQFCAELARSHKCYVAAGYPERLEPSEASPDSAVGANCAALYGPEGDPVGVYRKTNLFRTDTTWAMAGTGFTTFALPPPLGNVTLGICMDLNAMPPYEWSIAEGPYELADYCIESKTQVLVLLNAWLDSGEVPEDEYDMRTIDFWAKRLRPLWQLSQEGSSDSDPDSSQKEETFVVVCNRGGVEMETKFAGSSAIFRMTHGRGKDGILRAALGREDEDVLIWDSGAVKRQDDE
ncbi:carbon-nitrogen hydrolase [Roridomyces roridus]|uniref:Carbon-nitrogen hydrolase n=1 Tax=Roridomyces roridus TaxID=1738132 RepID=A0AAD7CAH3_9AGAR|nr:carbon-nitrogen hydrolase [Roridomyces roridus]